MSEHSVVTGAFSYTGKYITQRLLDAGEQVRTLTGHPDRPNPFGGRVDVAPLTFDDPRGLRESLNGASTLYNTYWVRFPYGKVTFESVVTNTERFIVAAKAAGVRRIVHVSVTNASEDSPFPYFRGKGQVERLTRESGLTYAIIRPTLVFGTEDVLINNIAWLLRRFPVFAIAGSGEYRLQPVSVEDVADLAVDAGRRSDNVVVDAAGPDVYTFDEMVRLIAAAAGSRARLMHVRPAVARMLVRLVGYTLRDVILTADELGALMAELLLPSGPSTGRRRLSEWLAGHADQVGANYVNDIRRHWR